MRSIGRSVRSVRSVCEINIFVRFVPHVSAPPRTKICEIRVLKNIRVIRVIRVKKNLVFKMMSVQNDEWFKMISGSFVVSGFM